MKKNDYDILVHSPDSLTSQDVNCPSESIYHPVFPCSVPGAACITPVLFASAANLARKSSLDSDGCSSVVSATTGTGSLLTSGSSMISS